MNFIDHTPEIRAGPVELVDEDEAGQMFTVRMHPDGLGLRFDPADAAEDHHRAIDDPDRAHDFGGEVDVTRRVDQVDAVALPMAGRGGGHNGDAALALLLHEVHLRVAGVYIPGFMDAAGVV